MASRQSTLKVFSNFALKVASRRRSTLSNSSDWKRCLQKKYDRDFIQARTPPSISFAESRFFETLNRAHDGTDDIALYFTHVGTSFHVMPVHLFHAMSVRFWGPIERRG
jgi:hypothetical protein